VWRDHLLAFIGEFDHPAWGTPHSHRVYELALRLSAEEGLAVDQDCLFAAAFLHDIGAMEPYRREGVNHAERSAEAAVPILAEICFPPERVERVMDCILGHMFYARPEPWPEVIVFHDADALDFMGSIGIARILAIVGIDDWTPDLRSAIEVIRRFRNELPDALITRSGKFVGEVRRAEMEAFLAGVSEGSDGLRFL
jgi:uncharacterized protein